MEKTVSEAISYRRSVRVYKDESIDSEKVKQCLVNASLAPTSSNLQLWEFYHITDKDTLGKMAEACLGQNAAKTAQQIVVVVSRKDLWRKRAKANLAFLDASYGTEKHGDKHAKRKKMAST